jgi:hypothetical protein
MQPGTTCFTLSGVNTETDRMHIIHQRNHRFNHQATFVREPLLRLREQGVEVPQFGGPWLATTLVPGSITVNMTRSAMNATDPEDYQKAESKMRRDVFRLVELMKEHVEEFKDCYLTSIATVAGVRESRRIVGEYRLTAEDIAFCRNQDDVITISNHGYDIHNFEDVGNIKWAPIKIDGEIQYVISNAGGFGTTTPPPDGKPVVNAKGQKRRIF